MVILKKQKDLMQPPLSIHYIYQ